MSNVKCGDYVRVKDLTGQRFGRLSAIRIVGRKNRSVVWMCKCDCGNIKDVSAKHLVAGSTKSCGCLVPETMREKLTKHGEAESDLGKNWYRMRSRCRNNPYYKNVSICQEWSDYNVFAMWAKQNGYMPGLSLDRIDVNGNYEPSNCRWVTWKEQQNNKRNTTYIAICGQTRTLTEWSDISGIKRETIRRRLKNGWREDYLLIQPDTNRNRKIGGICRE